MKLVYNVLVVWMGMGWSITDPVLWNMHNGRIPEEVIGRLCVNPRHRSLFLQVSLHAACNTLSSFWVWSK